MVKGWHGERQRHSTSRKGIRTIKNNIKIDNINWYKDSDFDMEGKSITVYRTSIGDWSLMVYPIQRYHPKQNGWEYELFNEKTQKGYDSLFESSGGDDHADTPEKAMQWAENTLKEWDD